MVPVRLGSDALGGAVNLVTDATYRTRAVASYQVGSFSTHRATLDARYRHDPSGFVAGSSLFFDNTKNNYPIDVELENNVGRPYQATVRRFHDGYRAYGGHFEAGVVDRRWAKRLLVRGFWSTYDKDLQHNMVMAPPPYGEVTYGETVYGGTARYDVDLRPNVELSLTAKYSHRIIDFQDKGEYGSTTGVADGSARGLWPVEVDSDAKDLTIWQDAAFGRAMASWIVRPSHTLRLSTTPTYTTRTGDERIQNDPRARSTDCRAGPLHVRERARLRARRILGSARQHRLREGLRLSRRHRRGAAGEDLIERDTASHTQGVGDSLRFEFTPWLLGKTSYEFATRLPRPDEVFGNGVLIHPNLGLRPESSHNLNLGPRLEFKRTPFGAFVVDVNAFLRETDRLIVLLGDIESTPTRTSTRHAAWAWRTASPGRLLGAGLRSRAPSLGKTCATCPPRGRSARSMAIACQTAPIFSAAGGRVCGSQSYPSATTPSSLTTTAAMSTSSIAAGRVLATCGSSRRWMLRSRTTWGFPGISGVS